ncbi:MAG: NADP-dependent isocitrate dehydrogenase [Planctomycetes bacterium]|nr:NADP-dependent isocitrate dehydrogenase [Planctomycetota bacterium]
MSPQTIVYTLTDEAPALATHSLLPIIRAVTDAAHIRVDVADISLAARILAAFPESLEPRQRVPDALADLGRLCLQPDANIIKLPNISASLPQLKAAIAELRSQGFAVPEYSDSPTTDAQRSSNARYDKVKGSAVNPVIRQGNSDRRATKSVKAFAKAAPHKMGAWASDCKTHVASMHAGDFFGNEQSITVDAATTLRIEFAGNDGSVRILREGIAVSAGEIVDSTFMSARALGAYWTEAFAAAKRDGLLLSVHLKATMMKVSDPILFGFAVKAALASAFERHGQAFQQAGVNARNGIADMLTRIDALPSQQRDTLRAAVAEALTNGPAIAMVDSNRGITNLHVPSDVIIDASMPAMIREGGAMWNAQGVTQDTKACIPDRTYAGVYQATIDFCRTNGAFDPRMMGSVPNVGLMAQQAEEYGSHDKTFEIPSAGTVRVIDATGRVLTEHSVDAGDIWRACQTKDAAVRDWVGLAVRRMRLSNTPAVFWLDEGRAHDRQILVKVRAVLAEHESRGELAGLDWRILPPADACRHSLERVKRGVDTISVTGNVLRDYLTDLFPILELGTSAKMLSVVPLMNGGGLFETGAGGSAPKHVQQFNKENSLRWDSLGEFLALQASLEHLAQRTGNAKAKVLADALDAATSTYLQNNRGPARRVGEIDNRGSHFYLAHYWVQELVRQKVDSEIAARFAPMASELTLHEAAIVQELNSVQGRAVDVGGYYRPDPTRAASAMRPSATFNAIIDNAMAMA